MSKTDCILKFLLSNILTLWKKIYKIKLYFIVQALELWNINPCVAGTVYIYGLTLVLLQPYIYSFEQVFIRMKTTEIDKTVCGRCSVIHFLAQV